MRIFKRDRLNFIDQKKLVKYLKYALGEIILVVIGILIALEIDTLNKNWETQKEEQKILQNLKSDYQYNLDNIKMIISHTDDRLSTNGLLINLTGPDNSTTNEIELDSLILRASGVPIYLPREGHLDELINTGKLEIIANDVLRNKLSLWEPCIAQLQNREETTLLAMRTTASFISTHGSWLNIDQHHSLMSKSLPKSTFKTDNRDLLTKPEFQNHLVSGFWALNVLRKRQEDVLKINQEVLDLITSEIKSSDIQEDT